MPATLFVLALLTDNNRILMVKRHNVSFGSGFYSLIGGKVEKEEHAKPAIKRKVLEETGLDIPENDFNLAHMLRSNGSESPFIALCFMADISTLPAPRNNEPDKHSDMDFFAFNNLPSNLLPAHTHIIECLEDGISYCEHGW